MGLRAMRGVGGDGLPLLAPFLFCASREVNLTVKLAFLERGGGGDFKTGIEFMYIRS